MIGIKSWEVIGYFYEGVTYCKACFERSYEERGIQVGGKDFNEDLEANGGVIFADNDFDFTISCFTCGEVIQEK